jgi:ADP-ribose pyrophosphatase
MTQPALEVIKTDHVYSGKIVDLDVEHVRLPNGRESVREIVRHRGAVVLVAVDDQERLLLVRQYRRAAGRVLLELPAGTRETDEDAAVTAGRELEEETGYRAGQIRRLGGFFSAPGFCTEYLECYLCTDLSESDAQPEADESFEHTRLTVDELRAAIRAGEVEDAKTLAGFTLYLSMRDM